MVLKSIKSLLAESSLVLAEQFVDASKPSRRAADNPPLYAEAGAFGLQPGRIAALSLQRLGEKLGWSFLYPSIRLSAKAQNPRSEVLVPV